MKTELDRFKKDFYNQKNDGALKGNVSNVIFLIKYHILIKHSDENLKISVFYAKNIQPVNFWNSV